MKYDFFQIVTFIVTVIFGLSIPVMVIVGACSLISITDRHTEVTEYDVFYVDAPFGRFYGNTHAEASCIGSSKISTSPSEAYTLKYWDDDEIKTIVLDACSDSVHLTIDDNVSVTKIHSYRHSMLGERDWRITDWYITITEIEQYD